MAEAEKLTEAVEFSTVFFLKSIRDRCSLNEMAWAIDPDIDEYHEVEKMLSKELRLAMIKTRKIDKSHIDYSEYIEKCKAVSEKYIALEQAAEDKYHGWTGRDHPAGPEIHNIKKMYCEELKELQKEYDYLFTEVVSVD